jgi:hypothetical protein
MVAGASVFSSCLSAFFLTGPSRAGVIDVSQNVCSNPSIPGTLLIKPGIFRAILWHAWKVKMLIPQVRLAHKYPISPWEMIHPPVGDNALCVPPYTVYTAVCNNSLTATYQYKISNPSNKVLVNNN